MKTRTATTVRIALVLLCAMLCFLPCLDALAGEIPVSELVRVLRSDNEKAAEKALDELLKRPDGKKIIAKVLDPELKKRARRLKTAASTLDSSFLFLDDTTSRKRVEEALSAHRASADDTMKFIFDDSAYPPPQKAFTGWVAGQDYQRGQIFVEGRVERTIGLYNKMESQLLKAFGQSSRAPPEPGGLGVAAALADGTLRDTGVPVAVTEYVFLDGTRQWLQVGRTLAWKYKNYRPAKMNFEHKLSLARRAGIKVEMSSKKLEPRPLAVAAGALFAGDYADAARSRPAANTTEGRIFDILAARHIMGHNETAVRKWRSRENAVVIETMNHYRMSLGLFPLAANLKLYKAAEEHSKWQKNNTMTHVRPDPGYRTFGERAMQQKYRYPCGENISSSKGVSAVWSWRADALHHRNMIMSRARAAGIATEGNILTYCSGYLIENPEGAEAVFR